MVTAIQFGLQSAYNYTDLIASVDLLVDKSFNFLERIGYAEVITRLKTISGFDKAITSLCFFMPFISKNIPVLLNDEGFSAEERSIFESHLFMDKFQDVVFNQTCLGDEWLRLYREENKK